MNDRELDLLLQYLKILQEGRNKPDRRGTSGSVKESLDNTPDIEAVKDKLADLFKLDKVKIKNEKDNISHGKYNRGDQRRDYQ